MFVKNGILYTGTSTVYQLGDKVEYNVIYPRKHTSSPRGRGRFRARENLKKTHKGMVVGFRYINLHWKIAGGENEYSPVYVDEAFNQELVLLVCEHPMRNPIFVPVECARKVRITNEGVNLAQQELTASEALYGFCGWLTTRKKKTVLSDKHDCGIISTLVAVFCEKNKLHVVRGDWYKKLMRPTEEEIETSKNF